MPRFSLLSLALNAVSGHRHWPAQWRSPPLGDRYDVVVVGAGGHGLAAAWHLARDHGLRNVAVLECLPGARMIAVTRDPRDQFVSRSLEAKARDTKGVGRFIKASRVTLEAFRGDVARFGLSDRVTEVAFEDFVADPALRRATAKGLGLDPARLVEERHFVAAESARNIGIHRGHARQAVIRKIERELMAAAIGEASGGGVTPRP